MTLATLETKLIYRSYYNYAKLNFPYSSYKLSLIQTHPTLRPANDRKEKKKQKQKRTKVKIHEKAGGWPLSFQFEIATKSPFRCGERETERKISWLIGCGHRKRERKGWKEGGKDAARECGARFLRNSHGKLTGGWVWALCALWGCLGVAARCLQKQRTAAVTRPATLRIRKTSAITNQIVCIPRIVDVSESGKERIKSFS